MRQRARITSLRRQSLMRIHQQHHENRRQSVESAGHDDSKSQTDDDDEAEDELNGAANGLGTGTMRYQFMTPEDLGDDVTPEDQFMTPEDQFMTPEDLGSS